MDKSRIGNFHLFPAVTGLFDFNGQILILENFQVSTQNNVHKYELRQINEDTIQNFKLALENENWEEIYKQDNINSKFTTFLNIFLIKYENSFQIKQRRYVNNGNKWITTGIRISCQCKRRLYMLVQGSHNHVLKAFYKKYCNILVKVIKEVKGRYFYELINKSENEIQTWKIIKK